MKRRDFIRSAALVAGAYAAPTFLAAPTARAATSRRLTIGTRTLEVNGKAATVYGLTGPDGRPGLVFDPGETFSVSLENRLKEDTIVHWHGLRPPWQQDGVRDNPLPMLKADETREYDFPLANDGTCWMHAHTLQEQTLLAAPLIVRTQDVVTAGLQEVVMMLHDFSFRPPEELLAGLGGGGSDSHSAHMKSGDMSNMDMSSDGQDAMDMGNMSMGSMDMAMGAADLNDIEYDAYLTNDRTLDDPEIVSVGKGEKVRLRIINGASSTAFWLEPQGLKTTLVAVDGKPVGPVEASSYPMTMAQRLDLIVEIPAGGGAFPVLARREGTVDQTGLILATTGATIGKISSKGEKAAPALDLSLETKLRAGMPLADKPVARKFMVHLAGDMASYKWTMMGANKIALKSGERVEIAMMNMSMMAHPMHLHGHDFQVVGIDDTRFAGAMRDTVLVPPMKTVTIAFDAGSPGHWPFHCHHLYHMLSGMMTHIKVA